MRGLTPPSRSGPLSTPKINPPADTPMPAHQRAPASRLLPKGLDNAQYIERFLNEFGATAGKPVVYTDVLGEAVVISDDLFIDVRGASKLKGVRRKQSLLLLADTIKKPDEIWWLWEFNEELDIWSLRRRYLARFEIERSKRPVLSVFDTHKSGWIGVTGFSPGAEANLMRSRAGVLAYRRGDGT